MPEAAASITMYGADWCGDCRRAKSVCAYLIATSRVLCTLCYARVDHHYNWRVISLTLRYRC